MRRESGTILEGAAALAALGAFVMLVVQLIYVFTLDDKLLSAAEFDAQRSIWRMQSDGRRVDWPCLERLKHCYQKSGSTRLFRANLNVNEEVCIVSSDICVPY